MEAQLEIGKQSAKVLQKKPASKAGRAQHDNPSSLRAARAQSAEVGATDAGEPLSAAEAQSTELAGVVQLKAQGHDPASTDVDAVVSSVAGDPAVSVPYRSEMEPAFGQSFGSVQAHTGQAAREACRALGAEAFAVGNTVAFDSANPSKNTVAHELAHVVQQSQSSSVQTKSIPGSAGDDHEREADAAADRVTRGLRVDATSLSPVTSGAVQRKKDLPDDFQDMWDNHPRRLELLRGDGARPEPGQAALHWPIGCPGLRRRVR